MTKNFYVSIGSFIWKKSPAIFCCKGLGSCIAIGFYDAEKKEGGLAHILLPHNEKSDKPFYYVNLAFAEIMRMLKNRVKQHKIVAKVSGGANIFETANISVGERNIIAAKYWLKYYNIPVLGEDLGGTEGRNISFDLSNGEMRIFKIKTGEIII